jgi:hypothetical protein
MRRTQLYLDDELWEVLHTRARREGTTISDLVRQAARERYLGNLEKRREAMQALIGISHDRPEFSDSFRYVRRLRRGSRTERLRNR